MREKTRLISAYKIELMLNFEASNLISVEYLLGKLKNYSMSAKSQPETKTINNALLIFLTLCMVEHVEEHRHIYPLIKLLQSNNGLLDSLATYNPANTLVKSPYLARPDLVRLHAFVANDYADTTKRPNQAACIERFHHLLFKFIITEWESSLRSLQAPESYHAYRDTENRESVIFLSWVAGLDLMAYRPEYDPHDHSMSAQAWRNLHDSDRDIDNVVARNRFNIEEDERVVNRIKSTVTKFMS